MLRTIHIGACALLATAIGCTQSYRPDMSTETGNPPVTIDSAKIALVVTRDEVHVQGEPGAVMPPEADVEITIVRTRDATLTDVEADGSFDAEVEATLDDVFEVRAILGEMRSDVVIVVRGGSEVIEGDGGGLSCEQQTSLGFGILDDALAKADRSCEVADDCVGYDRNASCIASCFGGYFSPAGLRNIIEAVDVIDDGVCASFEEDGCQVFAPPCIAPLAPACVEGQCVEEPEGGMECAACFSRELTWTPTGPGILPALVVPSPRTLSGCNTLEFIGPEGDECSSDVQQCPIPSGFPITSVLSALQHEDVMQAFAEGGGTFGYPEEQSGIVYELTLDGVTITYRSCAGMSAGVTCEPNGLEDLVELLTTLGSEYTCISADPEPEPEPEPDCTSPWQDDGMCDAAIPRWWHDPKTGACLGRIYGGCGGNGNSYASREECNTACPPPAAASACPPDRVFVEDGCFECGLAGGCAQLEPACLLVCSEDADCEGEEPIFYAEQTCSAEGTCRPDLMCE